MRYEAHVIHSFGVAGMMLKRLMIRLLFCLCLVWVGGIGAGVARASAFGYPFTFEIRIPKTASYDMNQTRVAYVASHGVKALNLWACKRHDDAGFAVFQKEFLIFAESKPQRGLIIQSLPAPSQVFRLSIPQTPRPQDWSPWQRPDYVEIGGAVWSFYMPDSQVNSRSTNVPPVCFEIRYKIDREKIE